MSIGSTVVMPSTVTLENVMVALPTMTWLPAPTNVFGDGGARTVHSYSTGSDSLPARSVATTTSECVPTSTVISCGEVHAVAMPPSRAHVKVRS